MSWAGSSLREAWHRRLQDRRHPDIYLGTRLLAVCQHGEKVFAKPMTDVGESLDALAVWLGVLPTRQVLRVWLSGGLCRPALLPFVPGVKGRGELQRIVTATVPQRVGFAGDCKVWIDAGKDGESSVCVAVEARTLDRLAAIIGAAPGHHIRSIRPWWSEVLRSALASDGRTASVAVRDCDSLTLLHGREGGAFDAAETLTPIVDRVTADATLARALLSIDVAPAHHWLARLAWQRTSEHDVSSDLALAPIVELTQ